MVERTPAGPPHSSAVDSARPDAGPATHAAAITPARAAALDRVAMLARGNEAAYEALVRSTGPRMHALARRHLGNDADADDAVQDAFVRLFRNIGSFDGRSSVETWLHRIVVNRALDLLRERRRRRQDDAPPTQLERDDGRGSTARPTSLEPSAEAQETRHLVLDAIDRLPPLQRVVVRLRDVEGLSLAEAARLLDLEPVTVRVRLHRARRALRIRLADRVDR